ncbi:porin family protein [Mucilaginibacter agri]|uniref:Outer membrane beta-barrel protein n=1 Tax=Mucilaginibacter agri TaxID=2695265 RepID=A0A966DW76_9SPHI|nr:porin family protein [Mucilaginibacter agri]NCD72217.1 outer membrane beta-barrel protein [Mucilaginibacter agri]
MKKITLLLIAVTFMVTGATAQLLPTFQFGIKGGVNLSNISTSGNVFNNLNTDNRAGFLGGVWARVGGAGIHFQPELYYTSKNVTFTEGAVQNKAEFKSIDVPLLVGTRIGAGPLGVRFNTGPLVSFAIDKTQDISGVITNDVYNLHYKNQNYAWQFGAGLDIRSISFDFRYELGLNKVDNYADNAHAKINMFNLTVAYRLFGL